MSNVATHETIGSGTCVQDEALRNLDGWEVLVDGEPRVRDVDLAERAGMAQPRDVRRIIQKRRAVLEAHGALTERARRARSGILEGSGPQERMVSEYWLTEHQAYALVFYLRTPKATELQVAIVRLFVAWRRGELPRAASAVPEAPKFDAEGRPTRGTWTATVAWARETHECTIETLTRACRAAQSSQFAATTAETGMRYAALARLLSDALDIMAEGDEGPAVVTAHVLEQAARELSVGSRHIRKAREERAAMPTPGEALARVG